MTLSPRQKQILRYVAVAGTVLGLVCQFLPHEYQQPCRVLATICTGGAL